MPTPLPIDPVLPELVAALRASPAAVLVAPPGSGKTTRAPGALLDAGLAGQGRVVLLQPRRVAARLAARRIAEERGVEVGAEVGYRIRFEDRTSAATRIEILTEGMLVRRLAADPFLDGTGVVVLDEFHERSLDLDLALSMVREAQRAGRDDLKLLVMSATLDPGPLAAWLGDAPILRAEGRTYPVSLLYDPPGPDDRPLALRCAEAVRQVLVREAEGHVLVFLPGLGEIRAVQEQLDEVRGRGARELDGVEVLPLHSSLRGEEQDRALAPSARRKVVLSTNIAETSVTMPGVRAVVDTGLARVPRYDISLGLTRLELGRISVASADQRAGRAGRTGPGLCRRLWSVETQRQLLPMEQPEIARVDLAAAVLELRGWGADPASFPWFEAPSAASLSDAESLLRDLGATDASGLTALGRRLLALPLHPRLGRAVLAGLDEGCLEQAAAAAALASERDPWSGARDPLDLEERVHRLLDGRRGPPPRDADRGAFRAAVQVTEQLIDAARRLAPSPRRRGPTEALARALLAAFPDRVGRRRSPGGERAVLVGGAGAVLDRAALASADELFLAVVLDAGERRVRAEQRVRAALPLQESWLPGLVEERVVVWDEARGGVLAKTQLRYHDLVLREAQSGAPDPEQAARLLAEVALADLDRALGADEDRDHLLARLRFLDRAMPALGLGERFDLRAWLPDLCWGLRSLADLRGLDWPAQIQARLTPAQRGALEQHAPARMAVPSGATVRLQYPDDGPPVLAARVQQLFGMRASPRLAGQPVLVHLLSPGGRPVQVTADLASFWANTYAEVRKDLRGRYPRHAWPEDPYTAIPEDRPRRRS